MFWVILFAYVTRNLATKYGIPNLFLYPEYLGEVDLISHMILGFCCGVFIMSYNISTYIINGFRFPFIATLSRPFLKFCYNNSLIPWVFTIVYVYNIADYQKYIELEPNMDIAMNILGFLAGNFFFIAFSTLYFITTNKDVVSYDNSKVDPKNRKKSTIKDFIHRPSRWDRILNRSSRWRIDTYLTTPFKIALARSSTHYEKATLQKVFSQNHLNASFFEVMSIGAILMIGFFKEIPWVNIPASASLFLLFAFILMLTSALHSWVKGWSLTIFVLLFIGIHYATKYEVISFTNHAYGMDYEGSKANYHESFLNEMARDKYARKEDFDHGIKILENWKTQTKTPAGQKPKIILINTSGGGLRSMLWTSLGMLRIDEALEGELMDHIHLITGSSGGMIGAAFVRELYLNDLQPKEFNKEVHQLADQVSQDVLNPITLNLVTSDLFYKFHTFRDGQYTYYKDRAYAFEKTLNQNMSNLFDKRLRDYREPEFNAEIPMMIFTPTVVNDGRRLIISPQPMSYFMNNSPELNVRSEPMLENIEFTRFFNEQDAENIRFTSILRMNATFPYVLPAVNLPSVPQIRVMDAGIRDNYGLTACLKYLYTFREWIRSNTGGVIILQMRDKFKRYESKSPEHQSFFRNITSPLDNFYSNWTNIQTFEQDQLIQYASSWFDGQIDVLTFQLDNDPNRRISLSWHLTNSEKEHIIRSLYIDSNREAIKELEAKLKN